MVELLHVLGIVAPCLIYPLYVAACHRYADSLSKHLLAWRKPHNCLLALYSAWVLGRVVWTDPDRWTSFSYDTIVCKPSEPDDVLELSWYLSKFWEWLDTAMLVAAAKPISALHFNHHLSTAAVVLANGSVLGRGIRTSVFDHAAFLNALAHTLMYAYYAWPQTLRPLRKVITQVQLLQHGIVMCTLGYTSYYAKQAGGHCDISTVAHMICWVCYSMYLIQFSAFYLTTYTKKPGVKSSKMSSHPVTNGSSWAIKESCAQQ